MLELVFYEGGYMLFLIKLLSIIAFFASFAWCATNPSYEPLIVMVTSLATAVGAWMSGRKENPVAAQNQTVAEGGVGIQAGGEVHIENMNIDQGDKNAR